MYQYTQKNVAASKQRGGSAWQFKPVTCSPLSGLAPPPAKAKNLRQGTAAPGPKIVVCHATPPTCPKPRPSPRSSARPAADPRTNHKACPPPPSIPQASLHARPHCTPLIAPRSHLSHLENANPSLSSRATDGGKMHAAPGLSLSGHATAGFTRAAYAARTFHHWSGICRTSRSRP